MRLNFHVLESAALKSTYADHQLVIADGTGIAIKDFDFVSPAILVMGSEGGGPSSESFNQADYIVKIDRIAADFPESLNVSIAAGIICHAWKG